MTPGRMIPASAAVEDRAWIRDHRPGGRIEVGGAWVLRQAGTLDQQLRAVPARGAPVSEIDCSGITRLDTAGAWLLLRTKLQLESAGGDVRLSRVPPDHAGLLETLERDWQAPPVSLPRHGTIRHIVERVGRGIIQTARQGRALLEFFGMVLVVLARTVRQPRRLRVTALFRQIEETGLNTLPILGLLSFLIGIVFAYQGADQLRRFGAEIYTINLLAISIPREIGGLMAAIIVAGRSGSSFTAQIGTMRVNEELDAMATLGLDSTEVLVLPRVIGLVIALPLLTFYANVMGLVGGALMSYLELDITVPAFLRQMRGAMTNWTFWIGVIKAPFFALIIALVGCFEGLQVERNAASVGRLTTQSVVEAIFLVIVVDAAFSILFSVLGI